MQGKWIVTVSLEKNESMKKCVACDVSNKINSLRETHLVRLNASRPSHDDDECAAKRDAARREGALAAASQQSPTEVVLDLRVAAFVLRCRCVFLGRTSARQ